MRMALRAKFSAHQGPRELLLSTSVLYRPGSTEAGNLLDDSSRAGSSSSYQVDESSSVEGRGGPAGPEDLDIVENSPHDFFWGRGFDGSGQNHLGRLLVELREELLHEQKS